MSKHKKSINQEIFEASKEFSKTIKFSLTDVEFKNIEYYAKEVVKDAVYRGSCSSTGKTLLPTMTDVCQHIKFRLEGDISKELETIIGNLAVQQFQRYMKIGQLPYDWLSRSEEQQIKFLGY